MSNYSALKAAIQQAVYTNGNNEITGAGLQSVLLQIVNTIGDGYVFKGLATAGTVPGTPDANVFYIAPAGTYSNFGSTYTVMSGNIGVFTYNGSWTKVSLPVSGGGGGRDYTDNGAVNSLLSAVLLDASVSDVRVTVGTAHDINIVFRNAGGSQVGGGGFYYSNVANMPAAVEFVGGTSPNIVYFDNDGILNLSASNYGGSGNVYYVGTFNDFAHDAEAFYEPRRTETAFLGGNGEDYTDDDTINAILPACVLTSDVIKVGVTIAPNAINIKLLDNDGNTIVSRYISDVAALASDVVEVNMGKNYLNTDALFIIDKRAFAAWCSIHSPFPSVGYREFNGTVVSASAYSYAGKERFFNMRQTRDWGTADIPLLDGLLVGENIYNTVDCFRFPAVIDSITIPAAADGIVEVYRTRCDDVAGVSKTTLLCSLKVKAGTYEYPVSIPMNAGEGIGLCSLGAGLRYYTSSGFRLASYNVSTLLRGSAPNGFDNGSMMCSVSYRYFASTEWKVLGGLKVSILGDSISTFGADYSYDDPYYPTSNVSNFMQTWWGNLITDGAEILANMSVSRSTVEYPGDTYASRWPALDARINGLAVNGVSPDVIIVQVGINDMYSSSSLGSFDWTKSFSDYSTLDRDKFKSAYQLLVMKLLDTYPSAKIFIGSIFKAGNSAWSFPEHNGTRYLMDMNAAIGEVASSLGVGFIDFYGEVGISWKQMNAGSFGDVIHPNAQGHYEYYKIVRRHLVAFVQENGVL